MSAAMAVGGTDGAMFTALLGCQRGTWAHSPLFQWMTNNYEAMSQAITGKKVRWQKMSEAAESAGLTNVNGEPPKPATVRSTWYRVRKAVGAMQRQKEEARNKVLAAREAAKASRDAEAVEAGTLSQQMQEADRAESYATAKRAEVQDAHARAAVQRQERTQQQAATTQQSDVEPSDPSEFITLDLPVLKGVSKRAYLPACRSQAPACSQRRYQSSHRQCVALWRRSARISQQTKLRVRERLAAGRGSSSASSSSDKPDHDAGRKVRHARCQKLHPEPVLSRVNRTHIGL